MNEPIKPGDFVRFRDDATTDGKPIGELFMRLTWRVVAVDGELIELAAWYLRSELKMHTLTYKMRLARPEETPS